MDEGQYYYLDKGQYNLLGCLSYQLGHPIYPKLFERDLTQAVGFTNRPHTGWLILRGGQVPISEYAVWSYHFNAGDYIDRRRYYFLDKGQYYDLDEGQYDLLGGLGYTFGCLYYQRQYVWSPHQSVSISTTPEPSTILYLLLGILPASPEATPRYKSETYLLSATQTPTQGRMFETHPCYEPTTTVEPQ